jgi:hypothetical protein
MKEASKKEFDTFFTADIEETLSRCFEKGGSLTVYPKGKSMLPIIREGLDYVILSPVSQIHKNGIYLFKRPNGEFALHRISRIEGDVLIFRGDAQTVYEKVFTNQLLAYVSGIYRNGKRTDTKVMHRLFVFLNSFSLFRTLLIKGRSLKNRFFKP